uniref:Uncharacterized protein n=1 Tax=Oryza barthii TaxID=65489 RepID=A0A0D3F8M1_9ORYZ
MVIIRLCLGLLLELDASLSDGCNDIDLIRLEMLLDDNVDATERLYLLPCNVDGFCSAHCKALLPYFTSAATATNTLSAAAASGGGGGGLTSTPTSVDISATLLTDVLKLYCDPLPDVSHRLCTPRPTPSIAAGLPVRRRQSSRAGREEICWH